MDENQIRMMQLGSKGYYCSQILIAMALEERIESNPGLVRAMAGLAFGCGSGRASCGALTGGACVLALYAGKGGDEEEESDRLFAMTQDLTDWFVEMVGEKHGGISCEDIVGENGPEASRETCRALVVDTFEKTMEILVVNDFDPAG